MQFSYDANGNLASLTPPGQPAHVFRYTEVDQEKEYQPPTLAGISDPRTVYTYNLDRQLEIVTRPDGTTVDLAYHPTTGRLSTVTTAEGVNGFSYYTGNGSGASAGEVSSIAAPGGEALGFEYDGRLPTKTTWSGPVAGIAARSFNEGLSVASETAGGVAVSFGYDNNWLLTSATLSGGASLTMTRDPAVGLGAGLLTGASLGTVATTQTPTAFAELQEDRATVSGAEIYKNEYLGRDALGRSCRSGRRSRAPSLPSTTRSPPPASSTS